MRNQIITNSSAETHTQSASFLEKTFFFHDIAVHCCTNHSRILALLEEMLGAFPEPAQTRGEVQYNVYCYEEAAQFPLQLPPVRERTDAIQLLTNTVLKYYRSPDSALEFHNYSALESVNATTLTVIQRDAPIVTTQLEMPERYSPSFLRRYVFLLALGHVMARFGFEPFHAAAISAPWDDRQGALLVGASGSGKTTLSVGCAIAGCGFLGDDLVMLRAQSPDDHIMACAMTREVAVRSNSLQLWDALAFLTHYPADRRDKRYCSIDAIRAGSARLQTPIRLLLFPTLTDDTQSRVIPMTKAQALQALIKQAISKRYQHHHTPETLFAFLSQLGQQATSYQIVISRSANDGPAIVQSLFTGEQHE
jgi:hypothetical protein